MEVNSNRSLTRIFIRLDIYVKSSPNRYGGIYLDLDVISRSSLKSVGEKNFVCAQSNDLSKGDSLASGIMSLDSSSGREIAEMFLEYGNPFSAAALINDSNISF